MSESQDKDHEHDVGGDSSHGIELPSLDDANQVSNTLLNSVENENKETVGNEDASVLDGTSDEGNVKNVKGPEGKDEDPEHVLEGILGEGNAQHKFPQVIKEIAKAFDDGKDTKISRQFTFKYMSDALDCSKDLQL